MKYLSLFSGIGGFEYGIQNSKWNDKLECIGASEIDRYAKSIYSRQFPEHKQWGDITKVKAEELPDFDLLVGGFPCQAFSIAGKQRGFNDTRGTLFFEIARICAEKRPKYLLLENVKGLLSHDKGKTFQTILRVLSDLGYDVQWQVLNSKNFGVPQNRERVFIKGYFRERCGREIFSQGRASQEVDEKIEFIKYGNQGQRIYDSEGVATCLNNGGSTEFYRVDDDSEIKIVGNFSPSNHHGKNVYSSDGISPTLCSSSVVKNGLNVQVEPKVVGNVSPSNHWRGKVYDSDGIAPSLTANDYKDPRKVKVEEPEIKVVGNIYNGSQLGNVYDPEGLSGTLCAGDSDSAKKIIVKPDDEPKIILKNEGFGVTYKYIGSDGITPTLTSSGIACGNSIVFDVKDDDVKLIKLNDKPQAQTVYDINGLGCTLSANGGGQGGKTGLYDVTELEENTIKVENIKIPVTHRKYEVPVEKLQQTLKKHKKQSELTIKNISEQLNVKKTTVEHWFRTDECFSIPNSEIWFDLKKLLKIETDEFDKCLTEFEEVEGVYDSSNRLYCDDGLMPTLSTSCGDKLIKQHFKEVDDEREITTTKNGDCFAVTTRPRGMPLHKKQDNYVLEKYYGSNQDHATVTDGTWCPTLNLNRTPMVQFKDEQEVVKCYGSTQKHRAETDGTYAPTLTSAMGNGGGHTPMVEFSEKAIPVSTPSRMNKTQNGRRFKEDNEDMFTLTCKDTHGVYDGYRIRRLTPLECERLQAFPDDWTKYGKDGELISDTQRYKCCGNAVTTSVITWIFNNWDLKSDDEE